MPSLLSHAFRVLAVVATLALLPTIAGAAEQTSPTLRPAPIPTPSVRPGTPSTTTFAPIPLAPQDPPELRALWVDAFHDGFKTPAQVDALVAWARQANFNALFVQVRRRGDAYYARSFEPRTEDSDLAPGFDALRYLLDRAHQGPQPLQVHAWMATLPVWDKRSTPPSNPAHVLNQHGLDPTSPDTWLMLRDDGEAWAGGASGGGIYYLDPGNPDAARYTVDVYLNLLRNYPDVDGLHLDQVRYYEGQPGRWGYNPTSVNRFNQRYGRDWGTQPDAEDPDWAAWRRDQVTALVRRVTLEAKAIKPSVVISAAVVAWGSGPEGARGWERSAPFRAVFQDWRYWLQEGLVDYVLPMDYYREAGNQAGWFDRWTSWQQANRGTRGVVLGVGGYLNNADQTMAQVRRARALNPLGVALYSYAAPTSDALDEPTTQPALAARFRALFPNPAPVPDLPWQSRALAGSLLVDMAGREGVQVSVRGPQATVEWRADGTGSAGAISLPPGAYTVTATGLDVDPLPRVAMVEAGRTAVVRYAPPPGAL